FQCGRAGIRLELDQEIGIAMDGIEVIAAGSGAEDVQPPHAVAATEGGDVGAVAFDLRVHSSSDPLEHFTVCLRMYAVTAKIKTPSHPPFQGFNTRIGKRSKSRTFRVTSVRLWRTAVAAIRLSITGTGAPCFWASPCRMPHSSATSRSTPRMRPANRACNLSSSHV